MLVRDVVLKNPQAMQVLARHQIDFCCGGDVEFAVACAEQGVDPDRVLAEVETAPAAEEDWSEAPLGELIDHIERRFHVTLRTDLDTVEALAQKVARAHREDHGEQLDAIVRLLAELRADLEPHIAKEEDIVFPWIRGGGGPWIPEPLTVEVREHESVGRLLRRLRSMCDDYDVPAHACRSWGVLWSELARVEADLHHHIHLENNVLFPRALAGA